MSETSVTIIGTLTRDPEIKHLANGDAVANFGLARNPRKKVNDEWVDGDPHFFEVSCWRTLAENVKSLSKGTRVIVFGELEYQSWEKDGVKNSAVKIKAEAVGPDLRWATAAVTKVTKGESSGSSSSSSRPIPTEDPFAT